MEFPNPGIMSAMQPCCNSIGKQKKGSWIVVACCLLYRQPSCLLCPPRANTHHFCHSVDRKVVTCCNPTCSLWTQLERSNGTDPSSAGMLRSNVLWSVHAFSYYASVWWFVVYSLKQVGAFKQYVHVMFMLKVWAISVWVSEQITVMQHVPPEFILF